MKPELILRLDANRNIVQGSPSQLNSRIAAGADLRISTGFLHNEHIDPNSDDHQQIVETSTFAQTVLIDSKWSAYFMTLRQPVSLPCGFGLANAMSLFLYNQDGQQAMARLTLEGGCNRTIEEHTEDTGFSKMHTLSIADTDTLGGSKNFIYYFDFFDYLVTACYKETYANTREGDKKLGDIECLHESYRRGAGIKIAVKGISEAIWGKTGHEDEIFIHCGSAYYYTSDKLMITNSLPFISVPADIPLSYKSKSFRYCWLVVRSDGMGELRSYNIFDNQWKTCSIRLSVRWFVQI